MSLAKKGRDRDLLKWIQRGATYEETAKYFNITRQRVHQIFRKYKPKPLSPPITLDKA